VNELGRSSYVLAPILTLLAFAACFNQAHATAEIGSSVLFLLMDPGSESAAMGGAQMAIVDDATGTYFNPAGLIRLRRGSLQYHSRKLHDDLTFSGLAVAFALPWGGAIGISRTRLELGVSFAQCCVEDEAYSFSYGQELPGFLPAGVPAVGVTAKWITSSLTYQGVSIERRGRVDQYLAADFTVLIRSLFPDKTYTGQLVSVPAWLRTVEDRPPAHIKYLVHRPDPGLSLAAGVFNVGGPITLDGPPQSSPLPQYFAFGLGYSPVDTDFLGATLAFDIYQPIAGGVFTSAEGRVKDYHIGAEVTLLRLLTCRFGRRSDEEGTAGINTWGISVGPETLRFSYHKFQENDSPLEGRSGWSVAATF